jgi:hypothetical protein
MHSLPPTAEDALGDLGIRQAIRFNFPKCSLQLSWEIVFVLDNVYKAGMTKTETYPESTVRVRAVWRYPSKCRDSLS